MHVFGREQLRVFYSSERGASLVSLGREAGEKREGTFFMGNVPRRMCFVQYTLYAEKRTFSVCVVWESLPLRGVPCSRASRDFPCGTGAYFLRICQEVGGPVCDLIRCIFFKCSADYQSKLARFCRGIPNEAKIHKKKTVQLTDSSDMCIQPQRTAVEPVFNCCLA